MVLLAAARWSVDGSAWSSFAWHGSAAALLVLAAACGERRSVPSVPVRALALVGDASYALYLVHPFVIRGLREVFTRLGLARRSASSRWR